MKGCGANTPGWG